MYIWFATLPSVKLYSQIFKIQSWVVLYPSLVWQITVGYVLALTFITVGSLFVAPLVDNSLDTREAAARVFFLTTASANFVFLVFYTWLLRFLQKVFSRTLALLRKARDDHHVDGVEVTMRQEEPRLRRSLLVTKVMLVVGFFIAPSLIATFVIMGSTELGMQQVYLWLNVAAILANVTSLFAFFINIYGRLHGLRVGSAPRVLNPMHALGSTDAPPDSPLDVGAPDSPANPLGAPASPDPLGPSEHDAVAKLDMLFEDADLPTDP